MEGGTGEKISPAIRAVGQKGGNEMIHFLRGLPGLRGVVHVGAHHGQEGQDYRAAGLETICWVEALPAAFSELVRNEGGTGAAFFCCALGAAPGTALMHVADNEGQSSSLLRPKDHLKEHPEVGFPETVTVTMKKLSELPIDFSLTNLLVMDVQGAELEVLRGGEVILPAFDYIIAEVQRTELYQGGALFPELAEWLSLRGFACERVEWQTDTWGNARFVQAAAMEKPRVHGMIFHWDGKDQGSPLAVRTHLLAELMAPAVDDLSVISSGGSGGSPDWIVLDKNAHFGEQWNQALAEFRGDVLFHHQADALLIGGDYARMVAAGRQAFRAHAAGVYAPRVDFSAHDKSHRTLHEPPAFSRCRTPTAPAG